MMAFNSTNNQSNSNNGNNSNNNLKNSTKMQDLLIKLPKASKDEYESIFVQIFDILDEDKDKISERHLKECYIEKLVDLYLQSFSERVFKILVAISTPLDECLFNILMKKINISGVLEKRFALFILISNIVHRSPTWLPNIINNTLLNCFFNILMNEQEVVILAVTALILVELTATLPCLMSQCLDDIFTCFSRLSTFLYKGINLNERKNPNEMKNLSLLHLNSIVYRVFIRLYAMYPCNFLNYLKTTYGVRCNNEENRAIFNRIIEPMLNKIRFHPLLITASKDKECDKSRWFYKEPHDILEECGQFSIDPIESSHLNDDVSQLYDFLSDNDNQEELPCTPDTFFPNYEENPNSIFSELAKEIHEKEKTSSLNLLKNNMSAKENTNNLESAQEAIMMSEDPSISKGNLSSKNLFKPVAISANSKVSLAPIQKKNINNNNSSSNNNNKKQCFSPFKPIKEIGISNFSQPEHDLITSKGTSPIDNPIIFANQNHSVDQFVGINNNDNDDVDMEIISYDLENKSVLKNRTRQTSKEEYNNNSSMMINDNEMSSNNNININEESKESNIECSLDKIIDGSNKIPDELVHNVKTSFKQINTRIRYQSNCFPETEKGENEGYFYSNGFPISMQNLQQTFSRSCPLLYFSQDSENSFEIIKDKEKNEQTNKAENVNNKLCVKKDCLNSKKTNRINLILYNPNKKSTEPQVVPKTCKSVDFTKETKARFLSNINNNNNNNRTFVQGIDHTKNAYFNRLFFLLDSKQRNQFPSQSSIDFQAQPKLEISSPHELLNRTLSTLSDVYLKDCTIEKNQDQEDHSNQTSRRDSVFNTNSSASSIEHIPSLNYFNSSTNEEDMKKILAIMYAQLVFERHQRDLHVIRNRRLYKKYKECIQLEEKYKTLKEQIKLQMEEKENLQSILLANSSQMENERKIFNKQIEIFQENLDKYRNDLETLQNEKIGLELRFKQEIEGLNKNFRTKELELNKYLCNFNKNIDLLKLEKENLELKNQLFLFGEFCGKIRDAYCQNKCQPEINDKLLFDSLKYENEDLKNKNELLESQLQWYMEKCHDLDNQLKQEEIKNKSKVSADELEYFREGLKVKEKQIDIMKIMLVNYEAHIQKLNGELSTKIATSKIA